MTRLADWPTRLYNLIEDRKNTPFAWGTNDCMMFAADAVNAITGRDYAADIRGTYTTEAEAKAILAAMTDAGDTLGVIDDLCKRVPVLSARRGDLVAIDAEEGKAIGVCAGGGCYFIGPDGLFTVPLRSCLVAWRVY